MACGYTAPGVWKVRLRSFGLQCRCALLGAAAGAVAVVQHKAQVFPGAEGRDKHQASLTSQAEANR